MTLVTCTKCKNSTEISNTAKYGIDDKEYMHYARVGLHKQYNWNRKTDIPWNTDEDIIICDECLIKGNMLRKQVKAGGVYFICLDCESMGVILPSKYATSIRKHTNKLKPQNCGAILKSCEQHGGTNI